jgi:MtN3 and saliva related transmembrane protein
MNLTELAALAGTIGGVLSVSAFLPQAYRIVQRRSAADVSLLMYVAILIACVLWMFYAHVHGAIALFWTNAIIAVIAIFIALLRIRYARRDSDRF